MAKPVRRYGRKWQQARVGFLSTHPWCAFCQQQGRRTPATVVDHITPHRGDWKLFWDRKNWQGLCETHHNSAKQAQEKTGMVRGCDKSGVPLDANHHWNE